MENSDDTIPTPMIWSNLEEVLNQLMRLVNKSDENRGFIRQDKRHFRELCQSIIEVLGEMSEMDGLEEDCQELIMDTISLIEE